MAFAHLLDQVLLPLLSLPTLWAVVVLSFLISLLVTALYKYTTDQNLMKQLKGELKEFQKEVKELRQEPQKAMEVQKKAMQTNMKYMSQSMRSTLYSIIPVIIIFSWMTANFAYEPIMPEQEFTTTVSFQNNYKGAIELNVPDGITIHGEQKKEVKDSEVKWILSGKEGEYLLEYNYDGGKQTKEVLITEKNQYKDPVKKVNDGIVNYIGVEHKEKKLINLFGWKIGWFGTYIILSITFSMILRKIMKVY